MFFPTVIKSKNPRHSHVKMPFAFEQLFFPLTHTPLSVILGLVCLTWIICKEKYTFSCVYDRKDEWMQRFTWIKTVSMSPVTFSWQKKQLRVKAKATWCELLTASALILSVSYCKFSRFPRYLTFPLLSEFQPTKLFPSVFVQCFLEDF